MKLQVRYNNLIPVKKVAFIPQASLGEVSIILFYAAEGSNICITYIAKTLTIEKIIENVIAMKYTVVSAR